MLFLPFFLSLILIPVVVLVPASGQSLPYIPKDQITLDCGSSGNNTRQGDPRSWNGDASSKFFALSRGKNNASIASQATGDDLSRAQIDPVPYATARLSFSEFSYVIPVTPGTKIMRLYFFSARYGTIFDPSKSFFSVKSGMFTLLSNFSVDLTARALHRKNLVKEFCVGVSGANIELTFSPSSSSAFAFINGIEVLSMPDDLYYPKAGSTGLEFVGQQVPYLLGYEKALEMMYRLNIGGRDVPPNQDTGFYRYWEGLNSETDIYLTIRGHSLVPVLTDFVLNFTAIPAYTAPADVYNSARVMGFDKEENKKYNLTWNFPVDPGFDYMVRLHFCEIVPVMNSTGDRVFFIYIANQTAESRADVIRWSGGKYVPYKKDYIVSMLVRGSAKKVNLSVALQANPHDYITSYTDAILNGVEIFKLSNTENNLAGLNPDPVADVPSLDQEKKTEEKSNRTAVIGIVAGVVSGVILLAVVVGFFAIRRGRKVKDSTSDGTTWWGPISFTTTKSTKTRGSSSLPSDLCRYFSLADIKAATNNFEDIFVIGVGGFGNVYKGYIDNGTTPVAIKRLKSESSQGAHEFKTEIEMLSHLRHRHLVSLIGYCDDHGEMILVYEYMARGTLRDHLYKTDNPPLPWKTRLDVCIGAARGLHYLHTGAKNTIIHRDVKTTNILLDEKWVAKVSDFGLSKTGSTSVSKAHVTTVVKGSIGYLDPEYYRRQQLSEKSDVYSFGVVLCEVLCGRPPILRNAEKRQVSLAEWARSCQKSGSLHQIIDPHLTGKIAPECLKKYGEIAVSCMLDNGTERPSMNDVVWGLEFALQLQQNAEDNDSVGGALLSNNGTEPKAKGEEEVTLMKSDVSEGTFSCSWDDTSDMMRSTGTGATKISRSEQGTTTNESINVFSEIYDPKGR